MVEPLLAGIVLGFVPLTITGLFFTAYLQYRRGDQLSISILIDRLHPNSYSYFIAIPSLCDLG